MSIKALDKNTVKKLTTSQVITSVFGVVKELVENSLDAGANNIEVSLKNKGLSSIEVKDNGAGISSTSSAFMALQGYTSKLSNFSELESLTTYGFRGEALSAICKVSKVQVMTRTIEDDAARCYTLDHNGVVTVAQHCHRSLGTTVRAENLFFNIPVRRQVITDPKTANKDIKTIKKWLVDYSICCPEVSITFTVDSKNFLMKHKKADYKECLVEIFGRKFVSNYEFMTYSDDKMKIELTVPKKELLEVSEVCSSDNCHVFINKRPVFYEEFEKPVVKIMSDYFKGKLAKGKMCFFLSICVSPAEIDVNLEPNKVKVLMINQTGILDIIKKLMINYYGLEKEEEEINDEDKFQNSNDITSPAYFDSTFNDSETEEEISNKKRKLTKKNSKSSLKKSKLASDDDKENNLRNKVFKEVEGPVIGADKVINRDNEVASERVMTESNGETAMEEDTLSQVPVIDIGEDFCTQEIDDKPSISLEDMELLEKRIKSISSDNLNTSKIPDIFIVPDSIDNTPEINKMTPDSTDNTPEINRITSDSIDNTPEINRITPDSTDDISDIFSNISDFNENTSDTSSKPQYTLSQWSKGQLPIQGGTNVQIGRPSPVSTKNKSQSRTETVDSGFQIFCRANTAQILHENPVLNPVEMAAKLAEKWRLLSPGERQHYRELGRGHNFTLDTSIGNRSQKRRSQVSEKEKEDNKSRLMKMLKQKLGQRSGSGKKSGDEESEESGSNKDLKLATVVPFEISIDTVRDCNGDGNRLGIENNYYIIGKLNDDIYLAKTNTRIWGFSLNKFFDDLNLNENERQASKGNLKKIEKYFKQWIEEKEDPNILNHIYDLQNMDVS
ncbi:PMS1 protein homolog 1-like [Microplitis mediator]|uniref:PMS1 protein homolog 1-like n=1 Tax=Microplitis mediator TaxID=375433 RepID=UPI0025528634|nr:PMS1 protein homolog 1-like [Microplitis mediator]